MSNQSPAEAGTKAISYVEMPLNVWEGIMAFLYKQPYREVHGLISVIHERTTFIDNKHPVVDAFNDVVAGSTAPPVDKPIDAGE